MTSLKIRTTPHLMPAIRKRLLLWVVATVTSYLSYYLVDPFSPIWKKYLNDLLGLALVDLLWSVAFSMIIVEICLWVDHRLDKLLRWSRSSGKRIVMQTVLQVVGSTLIILVLDVFFMLLYNKVVPDDYPKVITWLAQCVANTILVSLLISGMNTVALLLGNWKKTALEAAALQLQASEYQQAVLEAELQALKLQIDPHFIFNNLSVLSEIILKDQHMGYTYAENFAKVYKYLLLNSRKNLIALEEELKFLDAYSYMTKKRLGEGIVLEWAVKEGSLKKQIPPMTLQLLVENAIKHNQTSKLRPLQIQLYTNSFGELCVSNTLIPLVSKSESAGVGLNNIIHRFELLGFPRPEIEITESFYIVKLHLL